MTKAMNHTMIDQSKIFANTIQNAIIDALKKGAEGGYLGHAYYQPKQNPLVFQPTRRLMIQQQKLHHLHKLLLVLHQTLSRFRIKVAMVKLKILSSQHQCNLSPRIRCFQCRIKKNILPWEMKMGNLQDGIYLMITFRLTSRIALSLCLCWRLIVVSKFV
jgi:hypothetical protein